MPTQLSAKDGDRPLTLQFSLHRRADLLSRILVQLCITLPATLHDTHCPQMPGWTYLWRDLSHLVLGVYNIDSYMGPWDPFIISGELFSRVNGVWDVICVTAK